MTSNFAIPIKALSYKKYRPDIDGLRAVAVLSVVWFHAFPLKVRGGFIGVDIFFVISGFLISTIIFSNLENERFSIAEFYSRRIKRIFPALIIVLLWCLTVGWFTLFVDEFKQLGKHLMGGAGFVSNFVLWYESGYFDTAAESKVLLHLWSLAIEEHFYIFWPLLLAFVWKTHWSFLVITLSIASISFLFNIYYSNTNLIADFYSPISRFWELMIGGLLAYIALHKPNWNKKCQNLQSLIGCLLLLVGLLFINRDREFPGWWALLPTMGTFFVISAGTNAYINNKILSSKLLVWIGLISYPLYLWHWPILSFLHILEGAILSRTARILAIFISIVLAWLTYQFVEKPLRFGEHGKIKTIALFTSMCLILIVGLLANQVVRPRNANISEELQRFVSALGDFEYPNGLKRYSTDIMSREYYLDSKNSDVSLFIGDSHVEQYSPRIVNVIQNNPLETNTVIILTKVGCPAIPNVFKVNESCGELIDRALEIMKVESVKTVVIGGCWNCYFINALKPDEAAYSVLENGKKEHFRDGQGSQLALLKLEDFLKEISKTKKVYFILDNPSGLNFMPQSFFKGNRLGKIEIKSESYITQMDNAQSKLRDTLIEIANRAGVEVIDPASKICNGQQCYRGLADIGAIYTDANHFRSSYVRDNADFLDKTLFVD
jgi:peptidoglycan/LPS O-acetylase OafA/YrhL